MIKRIFFYLFYFPYYKLIFASYGLGSKLDQPILSGAKRIYIGKRVYIRKHVWLAAVPFSKETKCKIEIDDGTYIGNFCHIYAASHLLIGKNVLIADRVYLSDITHTYTDVTIPIIQQPTYLLKPVILKDGCWLGENVSVIGATVGKNSVVGAHSLVLDDIPDFCVAVGVPAKIIKRYDSTLKKWVNV